jgi:hypothetical protein
MTQLSFTFQPKPLPARQRPVLERLHQLLRRRGINPEWRWGGHTKGWILPTPCLDVGDRLRIGPRPDRAGIPATGAWETLCAWHINAAKHCPDENYGYSHRQWVTRKGVTRFELPDDNDSAK